MLWPFCELLYTRGKWPACVQAPCSVDSVGEWRDQPLKWEYWRSRYGGKIEPMNKVVLEKALVEPRAFNTSMDCSRDMVSGWYVLQKISWCRTSLASNGIRLPLLCVAQGNAATPSAITNFKFNAISHRNDAMPWGRRPNFKVWFYLQILCNEPIDYL